ncbi:MAG: hypothetical protein GY854_21590 [Deltaproteobacteria bacterium]|nr:hypothetical protein [Deltaproteobacteria bacterium]
MKNLIALIVGAMLLWCTPLTAAESAGPSADFSKFFGVSLGAKGAFGGNYLTEPDEPWSQDDSLAFESGAGGIGGGGGLYTEFRVLWGYLGLEIDLLFDHSKNWCSIEYSNAVDTDWIYSFTAMRIPLLIKGNIEMKKSRVSLGVPFNN